MKFDEIEKGIGMISMPEHNETYIESDDIHPNIPQHELTNIIHQEFQKTFIKKLYPNPVWTNRAFWVIAIILKIIIKILSYMRLYQD